MNRIEFYKIEYGNYFCIIGYDNASYNPFRMGEDVELNCQKYTIVKIEHSVQSYSSVVNPDQSYTVEMAVTTKIFLK
jgi:hypothetical protein